MFEKKALAKSSLAATANSKCQKVLAEAAPLTKPEFSSVFYFLFCDLLVRRFVKVNNFEAKK